MTYLLYPDKGHGIIRTENNRSLLAITEVFFGECLGGRYSALTQELKGSSVLGAHPGVAGCVEGTRLKWASTAQFV